MQVTKEQLKKIIKISDEARLVVLTESLNDTLVKFNINTKERVCHFMAQVLHESGNFVAVKENLNYSSAALLAVFKKYFNATTAKQYERQPERIANVVYANRMGNGDTASGDGWKYRGRSFIQITGKNNYKALSVALGVDFVNHPELLELPKYAMLAAGWFWSTCNLNKVADLDKANVVADDESTLLLITKKVNGGTNGLADRNEKLKLCKSVLV